MRRTKIVATIGPASESADMLRRLVAAGMDVARLNLSHGTIEEKFATLGRVREAAEAEGRTVAVLADLPGPKPRTAELGVAGFDLSEGQRLELVSGDGPSSSTRLFVDDSVTENLDLDDRLAVGDGQVILRIVSLGDNRSSAMVEVEAGGELRGRPGIRAVGGGRYPAVPTRRDVVLGRQMVEAGVDLIGVSFAGSAEHMEAARQVFGWGPGLVAKVETAMAVENLAGIVEASDAVMVARGDLGVECAIEDVPHLQKRIIQGSVLAGRPVITATQMLESMTTAPVPTRAEASDVANAVLDGTDAVMLSGETAIGHDPVLVVETMARIVERAEAAADYQSWARNMAEATREWEPGAEGAVGEALARAAWFIASDVGAAAIVCCTMSGGTVRAVARYRPENRLLGLTTEAHIARKMALSWGVEPVLVGSAGTPEELIEQAVGEVRRLGVAADGQPVVLVAGASAGPSATPEMLRVVRA
jgi:pyruvate kinase